MANALNKWNTDFQNVKIYSLEAAALDPATTSDAWGKQADSTAEAIETLESDADNLKIPSLGSGNSKGGTTTANDSH